MASARELQWHVAKYRGIGSRDRKTMRNDQVNDTIKISQRTEWQRKIHEAIKTGSINVPNNVQVNIPNLAALFNVSEKTIRRDLYVLRDLNLIKYVGSNKTGHWEVTD